MSETITKRTATGAAIGGVVGFLFGGPLGAGLGALLGGGVAKSSENAASRAAGAQMTPKRKLIFARAMESVQNPEDLHKLASAFHGEGFVAEAEALRKRAALRGLPPETKEKRRVFFRKAMASDDSNVIRQVAQAFQGEGALDAAKALFDHADAIDAAHLAGKSCKPMAGGSQTEFANKLAKAILHFGPQSAQAQSAAGNLLRSRGKTPTPDLVAQVIRVAGQAIHVEAPAAGPAPSEPLRVEVPEEGAEGVEGTEGAKQVPAEDLADVPREETPEAITEVAPVPPAAPAPPADSTSAPEPTVLGPPAPAVEPPAEVDSAAAAEAAPLPPPTEERSAS